MIVEDFCKLSKEQEAVIYSIITDQDSAFPFFLALSTPNRQVLIHTLLRRQDLGSKTSKANSIYFDFFLNIFRDFCISHNVKVKQLLRASVNYYINYPGLVCKPHVDHTFDHHNFLLYLTDCKGGNTLIYDDDNNIIESISPEKFKAVMFPGLKHAIEEFEPGESRFVVVFTFIKE
jgi:hypothetical protein